MAVFRIEKNKDYTVMSNHHLRNQSLSLKGKGLQSLFLSLPEQWDYSLTHLSLRKPPEKYFLPGKMHNATKGVRNLGVYA
jgi:hypothetical protein